LKLWKPDSANRRRSRLHRRLRNHHPDFPSILNENTTTSSRHALYTVSNDGPIGSLVSFASSHFNLLSGFSASFERHVSENVDPIFRLPWLFVLIFTAPPVGNVGDEINLPTFTPDRIFNPRHTHRTVCPELGVCEFCLIRNGMPPLCARRIQSFAAVKC